MLPSPKVHAYCTGPEVCELSVKETANPLALKSNPAVGIGQLVLAESTIKMIESDGPSTMPGVQGGPPNP